MKLVEMRTERYRSLRHLSVEVGPFSLFIGANAAGKSNILDALRFLHEAVLQRDFEAPMLSRGRLLHLAWKGSAAANVVLTLKVAEGNSTFEWQVGLVRREFEFDVQEQLHRSQDGQPPVQLMDASQGTGWWWSGEKGEKVPLRQNPTSCALAAAAADASFPAHEVAQFIERWGFFDPSPFLLRRDWHGMESSRLDHYGRNLAATLHRLDESTRNRILKATRAVAGLPEHIETRQGGDDDRFYFVQRAPGLEYPVHQMGASSGTLRLLALMTALHASANARLIGIEEPENYIHPGALSSLVKHLRSRSTQENVQLVITTHSPVMLDALNDPEGVRVVRRDAERGTFVEAADAQRIRDALDASGFGLGEYYQTRGFGN